jgi:hypothetical protein
LKRRAVLRSFLALPVAAALPQDVKISTTEPDSAALPTVRTFDSAQFSALRKLGEILMPAAQNAPGALEAGAPEFLDFLIGVSPPDRVTLYKTGLDRLNADAHSRYQRSFGEITAAEADPILAPLHAAWSYRGPMDPFAKFLLAAKSDLLTATANSREYLMVVSERRHFAAGVGQYWYPVE